MAISERLSERCCQRWICKACTAENAGACAGGRRLWSRLVQSRARPEHSGTPATFPAVAPCIVATNRHARRASLCRLPHTPQWRAHGEVPDVRGPADREGGPLGVRQEPGGGAAGAVHRHPCSRGGVLLRFGIPSSRSRGPGCVRRGRPRRRPRRRRGRRRRCAAWGGRCSTRSPTGGEGARSVQWIVHCSAACSEPGHLAMKQLWGNRLLAITKAKDVFIKEAPISKPSVSTHVSGQWLL